MPTFATPEPISARIDAGEGSIRLIATDRTDTVVEVRPRDPNRQADVRSAEQARVSYANGQLAVAPAKFGFLGYRMGAVDIIVKLPSRSRVRAAVASADVHADGEFADFDLASASGSLAAQSITGQLKAATASGGADIGELDGDVNFSTASGSLSLGRLRGRVKSQTASGSVHIAAAVSGAVVAYTSSGAVEVGVPEGSAARLDIVTGSGVITNRLEPSGGPEEGDETLSVKVRTGSGDVDIHRAVATLT
ncbi:DUF4097 family beta strand repeat-containing protein [Mycobacterium celatum]|uniref:DUF4097 domain-containing protein n=1 Tax=Mycobacterium celatum TaxID=28045 RepID=A0A1X1RNL4_MYCCE|nr:DUF4097 family beta strand repeat-containing protein [Mycobacterium celatum]ORV10357.1 hypothetical protein AWB95_15855 [Mycobacterium celatum]PIB78964.1 hypothetical protein CQY23_11095 [Mycobacterium celatum]